MGDCPEFWLCCPGGPPLWGGLYCVEGGLYCVVEGGLYCVEGGLYCVEGERRTWGGGFGGSGSGASHFHIEVTEDVCCLPGEMGVGGTTLMVGLSLI